MLAPRPHPFDAIAAGYDAAFTDRRLGRWARESVRRFLADAFQPGDSILELGCGTGEDAVWLARRGVRVTAIDASSEMLAMARRKATTAHLEDLIDFLQLDLGSVPDELPGAPFDGAFSNFGALNCLADRRPLARALARMLKPGSALVLVLMGPICPWEILSFGLRGRLTTALRRFRQGALAQLGGGEDAGATMRVWYPSPRRLRTEFAPCFRLQRSAGINALLPHSQLADLVDRWPRFFGRLRRWDVLAGSFFPGTWLNDHYLMSFERTEASSGDGGPGSTHPAETAGLRRRGLRGRRRRRIRRLRRWGLLLGERRLPELSVCQGYGLWATSYGQEPNALQHLEEEALLRLLPEVVGQTVLDLGCGKARVSRLVLERGAKRAVGVDFSLPMLEAPEAFQSDRLQRLAANANALPLAANSFDLVVCSLMLGHVEELGKVLEAMEEVLRPGGTLLLSGFHPAATRRGWQRSFVDVATGRSYTIRQYLHPIEEYTKRFERLGFALELLEEPKYKGVPMLFVLRARLEM
ncbi:MAG: class I SAM-dependent methyltransferase [Acidobacteriota bacterium]